MGLRIHRDVWQWFLRQFRALTNFIYHSVLDLDNKSTKIVGTYDQIIADSLNLAQFLRDLKHFDFNPKWKSRVINVPRAADAINELFDILFHGLRDKYFTMHEAVQVLAQALEGQRPGSQFSTGEGAMNAVVIYVGNLDVAWKAFGAAYHDAVDLVGLVDDIKRRIETLDDLFLPQGNPKKTGDFHYRKRQ